MKPDPLRFLRIAPLLVACSCATPKAVVVEETPQPPKEEKAAEPSGPEEPALAGPPDDGIRLPDMLGLPGENEFHGSRPSATSPATNSGAVIARPPGGQ